MSIRQAGAKPLLGELRTWMKALHRLSSKSETAGAIRYSLSRWRALTRHTEALVTMVYPSNVSYCGVCYKICRQLVDQPCAVFREYPLELTKEVTVPERSAPGNSSLEVASRG